MNFQIFAVSFFILVIGAPAHAERLCERTEAKTGSQSYLQLVQIDTDTDGVGGCVNKCKLDLEICLGLRPEGKSSDRCDKIEDECEDACYNSGPAAGEGN